ncbi:MAG: hypothetical protein ISQ09_06830 [Rubripirellula sp.]|nr:hypothetical protein [Rubripirellula sp.]
MRPTRISGYDPAMRTHLVDGVFFISPSLVDGPSSDPSGMIDWSKRKVVVNASETNRIDDYW